MQDKYVNPYSDFGFKRIFGQEAHKEILIAFLNALLPPQHQIANLSFINTEQIPPRKDIYRSILDLHCVTPGGERFIVEMQQKYEPFFVDRSVYYTANAITNMLKRGSGAITLSAVYFIGILDFVHNNTDWKDKLIREVSLKDRQGIEVYDKLKMIFVQMPYFMKTEAELETPRDKWLYYLKYLPSLDEIPKILGIDPVFVKAFEVAETANMNEAEQLAYFKSWDDMVTTKSMWEYDKKTAHTEGLAEGLAEGKKEAILETARKMKTRNMPMQDIMEITGLSKQVINDL